jgi:hypothetical protein
MRCVILLYTANGECCVSRCKGRQTMQQPPIPSPQKKSRKGLFIVLGVILVVALVGCIGVVAIVSAGGQAVNQTSTQVAQSPTTLPTSQPTTQPTQPPTPTSQPTPTPTACQAVHNNPWCYNFVQGNLIYNPPSNFCVYFICVSTFWTATSGYVAECVDGHYTHSGGVKGACSHNGGVSRPLYSH